MLIDRRQTACLGHASNVRAPYPAVLLISAVPRSPYQPAAQRHSVGHAAQGQPPPGRAHVEKTQAVPAHRNPVRQDCSLIPWRPRVRRREAMDAHLCQHGLAIALHAKVARMYANAGIDIPQSWRTPVSGQAIPPAEIGSWDLCLGHSLTRPQHPWRPAPKGQLPQ